MSTQSQTSPAQKITPQQALGLLEQATASFSGTRADHSKIVEALNVLNEIVNPVLPVTPTPEVCKTPGDAADVLVAKLGRKKE